MLGRPALVFALVAFPALAQTIYSWVDKNGVTHFTDDPAQVPLNARVDSTLLGAKQAAKQQPQPQDDSIQLVMDSKPAAQPAPQQAVSQKQPPLVAEPTRNDADIERQWRERFIELNRRISSLEQTRSALERSRPQRMECTPQLLNPVATTQVDPVTGAPVSGMQLNGTNGTTTIINGRPYVATTSCAINAEYDRITKEIELTQVQLNDARKDLEQLDRAASENAIPREWRRGW